METEKPSRAVQIGGTHYKGMKIEPFAFGMANHYDPAAFSVLKYVSRHGSKGGREDLKKASHITFIRFDEMPQDHMICARDKIKIETYISENQIGFLEAEILRDLHEWARGSLRTLTDRDAAKWIAGRIDRLAKITYGEES
jgi:hypothetical protein